MHDKLHPLFLRQISNLHRELLQQFQVDVQEGISGASYLFWEMTTNAQEKCMGSFGDQAEEVLLPHTEWTFQDEQQLLMDNTLQIIEDLRVKENEKGVNQIRVSM